MSKGFEMSHLMETPAVYAFQRVDFPAVDHFIEDARNAGVSEVRIDLFPSARVSELSFVYYVSLLLYVTALDPKNSLIYEYKEVLETTAALESGMTDEFAIQPGTDRLVEIEELFRQSGFSTAHGRFVSPHFT